MSSDFFSVNQPPTAEIRVRQFLDLSAEYLALVPSREQGPAYFTAGSDEALDSLREGLLAHMLMRKFITKGEGVYIPRVFEHLLGDYKNQLPASEAKGLRSYIQAVSGDLKNITENNIQYGVTGAEVVSNRVMMDRYLNGRLVHSDYDKWQQLDASAFKVMLASWLHLRANFRDHLVNARYNAYLTVGKHSLFPLPSSEP
ncbi:hypothetical protein ASF74_05440 [Arthrobacter sp. Leaf145]|nr:hypothetical protein ASF74_05440 [Arthrobacter sp. Leaf145]